MWHLHVLRSFQKKQLEGEHLKLEQVFKTGKVYKTLSLVIKMLSGFLRKEISLDTSSESGCSDKGKTLSQLIIFSVYMLKSYDLCLISIFEVYPTSNKCISTLILDILLDKKTNRIISKKE